MGERSLQRQLPAQQDDATCHGPARMAGRGSPAPDPAQLSEEPRRLRQSVSGERRLGQSAQAAGLEDVRAAEAALPAHLFALAESPGLALGFFPSALCTGITADWDAAPQSLSTSLALEGCYTSSVQQKTLVTAGGIPPGL